MDLISKFRVLSNGTYKCLSVATEPNFKKADDNLFEQVKRLKVQTNDSMDQFATKLYIWSYNLCQKSLEQPLINA